MLHPAGDREPGMDRALVGRAVARGVAEQQAIACAAANLEAERREGRLAAFIILVEIDEEGEHALLRRRDVGQSIAVLAILLAGRIAQHLQGFTGADVGGAGGGNPPV